MESNNQSLFALSAPRTIGLILHYFICYGFLYRYIATYLTLWIDPYATMILPAFQWLIYILTVLVTAWIAWPSLKHSYYQLKEKLRSNIVLIISMAVILLAVNMLLSIFVALFTKTNGSNNQELIREAKDVVPFITVIASCFVAPFVEECVFRCGAFAYLRKKTGFILSVFISSLLFASIHFINSAMTGNIADFSYMIVYLGLGIVLGYSYEKSDSVAVSFSVHFINNTASMLLMFL